MKWTEEKINQLKEMYQYASMKEIENHFGCDRYSVYGACDRHGIKRPADFLKAHVYNVKPNEPTQFKPGHPSWNKGKKMRDGWGGETKFKKGMRPHNWKPEGSERISKDGYIEIKTNGKYRCKHRIIWEDYHKEKLHPMDVVIFLDGNTQNMDINNLKKITRAEHMQRNHWVNLPKDLQEVIHLKKTITKLITENAKKQN